MNGLKRVIARVCLGAFWLAAGLPLARAEIKYSPENKWIEISGYPDEAPATLDTLLAADRKGGWSVVQYDATTDTYSVQASLHIGNDKDRGTYVQIGRTDHPGETVVVRGNVWIKPARKSVKRSDGKSSVQNRLILGNPTNAAIQATLKIDCSKPEEFGLFLGKRTTEQGSIPITTGAALSIFNSTLTAAMPDKEHRLRGNANWQGLDTGWYGEDFELVNAKLSWIGGGSMMYGVQAGNNVITGCVFEHGAMPFQNGNYPLVRNSVFRDLPTAVQGANVRLINCRLENLQVGVMGIDQGSEMELIGCMLTNNIRNVCVERGVSYRFIDCQFGAPKESGLFKGPGRYTEWESLMVKVTDTRGRPIPGAIVNVACPEDYLAVENGLVFTDAQGLTLNDPEKGAAQVVRRRLEVRPGADPTQPRTYTYSYEITAHAPGFKETRVVLPGDQPIARPVKMILKQPGG